MSNVIRLTKDLVLSKVSEYDIYCHYMGFKPILRNVYTSPLRSDSNPSFGLIMGKNGTLLYKDFGTSDSGDVFKFVKELYGYKYISEAIGDIYNTLVKGKSIKTLPKRIELPVKSDKKIGITAIPFNKEGREYWNSFGIDLPTLSLFNVKQVDKVYINGEIKDRYKVGNPIFAYLIYDKIKIYKPLSKDFRFYTDCNSDYLQGWKQLNFSKETLIITKSLKDIMVLYRLGITAIAPNGEGYDLPEKAVNIIKENFKNIIIFYDRDKTGIDNSIKLAVKYEFEYMFIPEEYGEKDISDFYRRYGKEETIKILTKKIKEHEKDIS